MIFLFDIDGTLTDNRTHKIVPSALHALHRLKDQGHLVLACSGRAYYKTKLFCDEVGITSFIANGGNSLCLDGKCIYNKPLNHTLCMNLIQELEQKNIGYLVALDDSIKAYMKDDLFLSQIGIRKEPTYYIYNSKLNLYDHNIYKIYIAIKKEDEHQLEHLNGLTSLRFAGEYLTIQPDNKKAGIHQLLEYLGKSKDEVVVFGDDVNDLCMFDDTWFKIAMGNGHDLLKKKADFITKANIDDGILYALEYFSWI